MPEFLADTPRPLQSGDPVADFDCGVEELNRYLQRFAWMNQQANAAVTYVATKQAAIAGYYTIVAASAEHTEAPERLKKGAPSDSGPAAGTAGRGSAISRRWIGHTTSA